MGKNPVNSIFASANVLEAVNIVVSFIINQHFYANNSGCGDQGPSIVPTLLIGLVSSVLLGFGLVKSYRIHYSKTVTIVATISWIGLSLIAIIALSFHICF